MDTPSETLATTSATPPSGSRPPRACEPAYAGVSPGLISAPLSAATLASRSVFLAAPGARPQPVSPSGAAANADVSMCATDGGDLEVDDSSVGEPSSSVAEECPTKIISSSEGIDPPCEPGAQGGKPAPGPGEGPEGDRVSSVPEGTNPKVDPAHPSAGQGKRRLAAGREESDGAGCRPTCMSISAEDRDRLLLETGVTLEEAEERWWKGYFHDQEVLTQLGKSGISTIADWFQDATVDAGDRPFLVCPDENVSLSYRNVNECVNAVAVWAHFDRRGEGTFEAVLRDSSGCFDDSLQSCNRDSASPGLRLRVAKDIAKVSGPAEDNAAVLGSSSVVKPEERGSGHEERLPGKQEEARPRDPSGGSWEILPSPLHSRESFDCESITVKKEEYAVPPKSDPATSNVHEERQILHEGATVAVFMSRRVECLVTVLGLSRARLVVALVPTHLRGIPLMSALTKARPTCIFVDEDTLPRLRELYSMISARLDGKKEKQTRVGPGAEAGIESQRHGKLAVFPVFVYGEWEKLRANVGPREREPFHERDLLGEIRQAISTCVSPLDVSEERPAAVQASGETGRNASSPSSGCSPLQTKATKLLLPPRSPSLSVVFNLPWRSLSAAPLCWACLEPGDSEACRDEEEARALKTEREKREVSDLGDPLSSWCSVSGGKPPRQVCAACGSQPENSRAKVPALFLYVSVPQTVLRVCKGRKKSFLETLGFPQVTDASFAKKREGAQNGEKGHEAVSDINIENEQLELLYPVRLSHRSVMALGVAWARDMSLTPDDVVYCPLPLQGETGGLAVVAAAIQARAGLVLPSDSRTSSRSLFWSDIATFGCTLFAYSSEVWPRLFESDSAGEGETKGDTQSSADDTLSQGQDGKTEGRVDVMREEIKKGETHRDKQQRLRGCIGEGMTAYTWQRLKKTVPCIETFVECHFRPHLPSGIPLANSLAKMGACGFVPNSVQGKRGSARLVRFDETKQDVVRSKETGRCLEPEMESSGVKRRGEAVVRVDEQWLGFVDEEITSAMLYRNAFHTGDAWCRSGDLMDVDRMGFFYFVARLNSLPRTEKQIELRDAEGGRGVRMRE
ncbi:amp-binding enzyme [Cystoisospora suis]|uniref:Amp-binding enzyme n=1 Tax=Cystoisospora suis TaxID=483139 RepID=A0A2C6KV48_9APIC|nr:amp-binding enzyme [Cystoisospora suis]